MTTPRTESYSDIVRNALRAGVSFRRYGQHGELRRAMVHRFPASKLKCECSVGDLVAESMMRTNTLLPRLMQQRTEKLARTNWELNL